MHLSVLAGAEEKGAKNDIGAFTTWGSFARVAPFRWGKSRNMIVVLDEGIDDGVATSHNKAIVMYATTKQQRDGLRAKLRTAVHSPSFCIVGNRLFQ